MCVAQLSLLGGHESIRSSLPSMRVFINVQVHVAVLPPRVLPPVDSSQCGVPINHPARVYSLFLLSYAVGMVVSIRVCMYHLKDYEDGQLRIWCFRSLMIHFFSAVAVTIRFKPEEGKERRELDFLEKFCFATFGVSTTFSLVVTLLFWILLFDPATYTSTQAWFFTLNTHAFNAVIALSNLFLSRMKPKLLHVLFSAIVALLYVPANAACSLSNGENVYNVWPVSLHFPFVAFVV